MSFDWLDYLKFARITKQLAEIEAMPFVPIREAAYRVVISRAYYAVFCLGRDFILKNRSQDILLSKDGKVHTEVINYFRNSANADEQIIGKMLGEMRDNRNLADYEAEITEDTPEEIASAALEQARKILDLLKIL
jgi:uncharacterized protein (UPF0332 family)